MIRPFPFKVIRWVFEISIDSLHFCFPLRDDRRIVVLCFACPWFGSSLCYLHSSIQRLRASQSEWIKAYEQQFSCAVSSGVQINDDCKKSFALCLAPGSQHVKPENQKLKLRLDGCVTSLNSADRGGLSVLSLLTVVVVVRSICVRTYIVAAFTYIDKKRS